MQNAMRTWGKKLAGFADYTDAIKSVIEHLPTEPPSLPEFVALCRAAALRQGDNAPRLAHRLTDEEQARADAIAREVNDKVVVRVKHDPKAWAKQLKRRHESGEKLSALQINSYREALGINPDEGYQEAA